MDMDMTELAPDVLLPIQVADRQFEGARLQPEKCLQLAALTDALRIHRRLGGSSCTRRRIGFIEVDEWFAANDADGPFFFVGICDSLNLDPDYVRAALRIPVVAPSDRRRLFMRRNSGVRTHVVRPRFRQVA